MQLNTVDMDTICEIASEIVERQWRKDHPDTDHSFTDTNGDIRYIEAVQDEFNTVLDIVDDILNPQAY